MYLFIHHEQGKTKYKKIVLSLDIEISYTLPHRLRPPGRNKMRISCFNFCDVYQNDE